MKTTTRKTTKPAPKTTTLVERIGWFCGVALTVLCCVACPPMLFTLFGNDE